jgi:hypothetical protein
MYRSGNNAIPPPEVSQETWDFYPIAGFLILGKKKCGFQQFFQPSASLKAMRQWL